MPVPCVHAQDMVQQVPRTIDLLRGLDSHHPNILIHHQINPPDYHGNLIFRSAVESIRGSYIASSITGREGMVGAVMQVMQTNGEIAQFRALGATQRYDFEIIISKQPRKTAVVEVKGGEGNSINISHRPLWADEFILWCHLDGAIVNQPAAGANAIIFNRVANEMVRRGKQVDAVLVRDALCGGPLRRCPKYSAGTESGIGVAPDVFLFPQRIPTLEDPQPPVHNQSTLTIPFLILQTYGVTPQDYTKHVWEVNIRVFDTPRGLRKREVTVYHQGIALETRIARA